MNYIKYITSLFLILLYTAPITISSGEFFTHFEVCEDACACCSIDEEASKCCVEDCSYESHDAPSIPIAYSIINTFQLNISYKIIDSEKVNLLEKSPLKNLFFNSSLNHFDISFSKTFEELISSQYYSSGLI